MVVWNIQSSAPRPSYHTYEGRHLFSTIALKGKARCFVRTRHLMDVRTFWKEHSERSLRFLGSCSVSSVVCFEALNIYWPLHIRDSASHYTMVQLQEIRKELKQFSRRLASKLFSSQTIGRFIRVVD